jgi:SAM-dependent methyltransferase
MSSQKRFQQYRDLMAGINEITAVTTMQELGVFQTLLDGPLTIDAIASHCGVRSARLAPFLDMVVKVGWLKKQQEGYSLVANDDELFDPDGSYWSRLCNTHSNSQLEQFSRAVEALETDKPVAAASTGGDVSENDREQFLLHFDAWVKPQAEKLAAMLSGYPILRIADLGCGSGSFSFELLARNPKATAVLVDRETAGNLVRELSVKTRVSDRVRFIAVDLLAGDFGSGYDLILISNVIHCYGMRENLELLKRAASSLRPGGRLVIKDYICGQPEENGLDLSRFALQLAMFSQSGTLHSEDQVLLWLHLLNLNHEITHRIDESYVVVAKKEK